MVGLNLHSFCDAMEKSDKCVKESIKGFKRISKRKKASKEGGDRIVGGNKRVGGKILKKIINV